MITRMMITIFNMIIGDININNESTITVQISLLKVLNVVDIMT